MATIVIKAAAPEDRLVCQVRARARGFRELRPARISRPARAGMGTSDHESVGPAFPETRAKCAAPVTIAQDLTGVTITKNAVGARQIVIDPFAWPMAGPTTLAGRPVNAPSTPLVRWADALIAD